MSAADHGGEDRLSLPSAAVCDEAISSLAEVFDGLTKEQRQVHAGAYRDVKRLIERVRAYVLKGGGEEKKPMSKEEVELSAALQEVIALIDKLVDDDRVRLFDELVGLYCSACGYRYKNPKDEMRHDDRCEARAKNAEDNDEDDEDDEDDGDEQDEPDEPGGEDEP